VKEKQVVESREVLLKRFREKIRQGLPIIGGGAGTGISAKFEEAGGIDLIVIYNSGRFRMAGHGSLAGLMPFGDANQIVLDMANEVLPVVKHTPVLAGVCGVDPMRLMDHFLRKIKETGFAGVQNFPTVGLIDGTFRANLEETNLGYAREVEMIRLAREMDLLTTPYVFNTDEAAKMVDAGADILVAHMGLTTSGSIGAATAKTLADCVPLIDEIATVAKRRRDDVIVLCHGGPIAEPDDAAFILRNCPAVDGFYGASSMERLPTEQAIRQQTERFTRIRREKHVGQPHRNGPKHARSRSVAQTTSAPTAPMRPSRSRGTG
jgi:predicted TIM-barrel enzyme